MGGKSKGGGSGSQQDAQAKYEADLANWRAPTTTGAGTAGMAAVSNTPNPNLIPGQGGDMGPALPPIVAPPVNPRNVLAQTISGGPNYNYRSGLSRPDPYNTMPYGSHR